ncbi:unnamed protein product [Caenorhabditis auriculariae]|uniref:Uncharacterized protein n=1 Tax=Caenorhabditis auriculariae TaxID=2777116 RepID=A0A8S1GTA4_9PELO|nr:unnamed protein product [Caenorhabditis auriculariae]
MNGIDQRNLNGFNGHVPNNPPADNMEDQAIGAILNEIKSEVLELEEEQKRSEELMSHNGDGSYFWAQPLQADMYGPPPPLRHFSEFSPGSSLGSPREDSARLRPALKRQSSEQCGSTSYLPQQSNHFYRPLLHQHSTPNFPTFHNFDEVPVGPQPEGSQIDPTLESELEGCGKAILMALGRMSNRNIYRQVINEVADLYFRVVCKGQLPKKSVKRFTGTRSIQTEEERAELETALKCLAAGLHKRNSNRVYEMILTFMYKLRLAIHDY